MLRMAVAWSSFGVVVIRYVLPVFVYDIMFFFYNWPYSGTSLTAKDQLRLSLLIYHKVGQDSISYY